MITFSRHYETAGKKCAFYLDDDFVKILSVEDGGAWFLIEAAPDHLVTIEGKQQVGMNNGSFIRYRIARRPGEQFTVGEVTVQILRFEGKRVLIGIEAPATVNVAREG